MRYYDPRQQRLVYVETQATPDYWDQAWSSHLATPAKIRNIQRNWVTDVTHKYLRPQDGRILEGGCGYGQQVAALTNQGYQCIGIDYAQQTVAQVNRLLPDLHIQQGDVRALSFADGAFVGYWSLGVIEHFWDGYEPIGREMARVLAPGGYLFLTFPYMSPVRQFKARWQQYPLLTVSTPPDGFYQFALNARRVAQNFAQWGFQLLETQASAGLNGLKAELPFGKTILNKLYNYNGRSVPVRGLRYALDKAAAPVTGHIVLLVLRRL